jgi:hypothetical protein
MNRLTSIFIVLYFTLPMLNAWGAILIEPGETAVIVKKLPVEDCRVVRGFLGTPVDGSTHSWDYGGNVREYPRTASDGIAYSFNNNDGLHITLSDDEGFDLVVLRGGARTRMYADVTSLTEPQDEEPLWKFQGGQPCAAAYFEESVKARKVSFFGTENGSIADVSFYRIEKGAFETESASLWTPSTREEHGQASKLPLREPESEFAPESLHLSMKERYGEGHPLALTAGEATGASLPWPKDTELHLISPPFQEETGLAAIALDIKLSGFDGKLPFTAVVQDPLDPRLDLVWLDFMAEKPGRFRLVLDIPDQVMLENNQLWITLKFDADVNIAGPADGSSAQFWLHFVSREEALPEALDRRKMLMKTFFSLMSEPRPWGNYREQSREEFYKSSRYARQCPELFMTIDQCHALDPTDDMVRQYREWVYLRHLEEISEVSPPPDPPEGVPAWAWYPRLAWLEVRRIANWWLEERLVMTGEFGGRVGDDSDFYQEFADLPFFETSGVADRMMDSAARMAELADKENLRDGLNIHATDSLHAYEEGINHLALIARWFYGDPIYLERCMESARNMEHLTILTEDGRRHFRDNGRMGHKDIENPGEPRVDGGANPLMWHTAFQVADYNRNSRALKILREWGDTWLKFMKPGQWATDIEVLSGKVVGAREDRPLYGGYSTQACTFTWLYALTGDERYIQPFLHYYRQGKMPLPANIFLSDVYTLGGLGELERETLERLIPHNPAFALYHNGDAESLVKAAIGNQRNWIQGIDSLIDARRWPDMYTTTHQFTDRVFPGLLQHASASYLGGFCRRNKFNPTLAVGWEGFGTDYAALVLDNQQDSLKLLAYSFADKPVKGNIRVWALEHGVYEITIGPDANGDNNMDSVEKTANLELAKADRIELALSPEVITVVELKQLQQLDPISIRADLAITAREVEVNDNILTGVVHNIGSKDVRDVVVAVVDADGQSVSRKSLGELAAPVDLIPKSLQFTIELPKKPEKSWELVLDPDRRVPEIYEGNNEVELDALPAIDYARRWD